MVYRFLRGFAGPVAPAVNREVAGSKPAAPVVSCSASRFFSATQPPVEAYRAVLTPEAYYRQALDITGRWYGENHHATAANLTMLGRALSTLNEIGTVALRGVFTSIMADILCPTTGRLSQDSEIQIERRDREARRVLAGYRPGDLLEGLGPGYHSTWVRTNCICKACRLSMISECPQTPSG